MTFQKSFQISIVKYNNDKLIGTYSVGNLMYYPSESDLTALISIFDARYPENKNFQTQILIQEVINATP